MRLAIDTGGTFTDCVYWQGNDLRVLKLPSTPDDPSRAVLDAVMQIAGGDSSEVRHGTTVGTNALLERKGARTAFITTAGFEDTIEIGRQARGKLYDWSWRKPAPLAPREMRFGLAERISPEGRALVIPPEDELARVREQVASKHPEAIAVSLLFSFVNPAHEQALMRALEPLGVPMSVSHLILPEFREYERGTTVLINAYLAPKMQTYLGRLDRELQERGSRLHVMHSAGGIIPAGMAAREPVRTILSGPAGGVIGAVQVARIAGFEKILTFDMGGTSTDVALVDNALGLETTTESQLLGMPVSVPMLRIHTVGAGGGSLAAFDRGGALSVGPESAGADPGPACYGSGERPTVTDANLFLGRIEPNHFLGGGMKLDEQRSALALHAHKGPLATARQFAEGIVQLADARMEQALREISVEQGYDPRDFVLVAFGGAGPLHACALARALRIPKVLVPSHPGALSAYGILTADVVRNYSRTVMLKPGDKNICRHLDALIKPDEGIAIKSLDMRYQGQGYELNIPWQEDHVTAFHRLHEQRYGYADPARPIEVVNVRVRMLAATEPVARTARELQNGDGHTAVLAERNGTTIYQRTMLQPGDRLYGPAVIVEYSATTFLPSEASAQVDGLENLIIDPGL